VGAVVQACAGVPLALRLAGSRLAATPYRSLGELANLLSDPASALDQFTYGDVDLRVLLEQAYRTLSPGSGRIFRLIGLLPRVPLPAWLVASAAATPVEQLAAQLDELVTARLLEVAIRADATVRYQLHPLVHLVAQRLGRLEEPVDGRAGVDRALAAYLDELAELNQRLGGGEYLGPVPPPTPSDAAPAVDPRVWFARERVSLLALIDLAAGTGRHEYAWQLAVAAAVLFRATGRLDDWRATHQAALAAAQRASDPRGEAAVLCSLGSLGLVRGDRSSSGGLLRAAALWQELGDPIGRAHAVRNLAQLDQTNGSYPSAAARYREAAQTFARHGDQVAQGYSLAGLVQTHLECGNLAEAYPLVRELLALSRDCRDRRLAAVSWLRLAETEAADGRLGQALQHLGRALTIAGAQGDRAAQARILVSMAEVQADRHDLGAAEAILDRLAELGAGADDSALRGRTALVRARVQQARGQVTGAENLIVTAAELFRVHGTAAWQDRALRLLSELRGGLPTVA
jgi:tetratricopeptide (TPR) repeat protein